MVENRQNVIDAQAFHLDPDKAAIDNNQAI